MSDFIHGFLIELGLVMTVGMQSAYIIKQGLRREYAVIAVAACFFSETLLVVLGIAGMGAVVNSVPYLYQIITAVGIVFLIFYALKSFYAALRKSESINIDIVEFHSSKKEVFFAGLAFALLNPHVIIDTTIMGSLAANYYPHQWIFGAGVIAAALSWYSFLGTAGSAFAKFLNKPKTWKIINVLIGSLCLYISSQFIVNFNNPDHSHSHMNFLPFLEDYDDLHDGHSH